MAAYALVPVVTNVRCPGIRMEIVVIRGTSLSPPFRCKDRTVVSASPEQLNRHG
jgi:hypothetical protein